MNKFITFSCLIFLTINSAFAGNSLEITTLEIQKSFNIKQRFPGKILPLNYSKLAFEVAGKIDEVKVNDYKILVIPGGVKAMEKVRQNKKIINFNIKTRTAR